MAFPTIISPVFSSVEPPGKHGPFFVGSNIYVINVDQTLGDPGHIAMMKSTDAGKTWAEADAVDHFLVTSNSLCACQDTTDASKLYIFYLDEFGLAQFTTFDASTDLWGIAVASSGTFQTGVCCHRASDNVVAMAYQGDTVNTFFINHQIIAVVLFDLGTQTWGSPFDLDYLDYADVTLWNLFPSAIAARDDGKLSVLYQQKTDASQTTQKTGGFGAGTGTFQVPGDCILFDTVDVVAGGGGGSPGVGGAGGGGGGWDGGAAIAASPGATSGYTVGSGGSGAAPGPATAGGSSTFLGFNALGGGGGSVAGGTGGAGSNAGGTGGSGAGGGGGGGGIAASSLGPGANGADATILGPGGNGGNSAPPNPATSGFPGIDGGGGGGNGEAGGNGGDGGDGFIAFAYTPFTNAHDGRLFHQVINPDNTLGTLQEITEGEFPFDNIIPFACDADAGEGFVTVAFSGVNATTNADIMVGRAPNADALVFDWQTISADNAGSELDSSPAIAADGKKTYLVSVAAPSVTDVTFKLRADTGTGFGPASNLGKFADQGCRLQIKAAAGKAGITFGTPTGWVADYIITV